MAQTFQKTEEIAKRKEQRLTTPSLRTALVEAFRRMFAFEIDGSKMLAILQENRKIESLSVYQVSDGELIYEKDSFDYTHSGFGEIISGSI